MSKCKITGKVLVIHLGREELRIVRMDGAEIQHRAAFVTPKGAVEDGMIRNPEAVREVLKGALKTPEFKGIHQAVFTLNTSQVISTVVTAPSLPESRLEKLLLANMDLYFPVDTREYHVIWQIVGSRETEGGAKELSVQLWAVPDAITQKYYFVANACGLSVAAIDYCGHSIATAVGADFAEKGKAKVKAKKKLDLNRDIAFGKKKTDEQASAPVAVEERTAPDTDLHITLEKELLGMTFVQEGRVVLQRFVRCGESPVYQFSELAMILEYFRSLEYGRGSDISGILSGDYVSDRAVCRELEEVLGIPLTTLSGPVAPQMVLFVGASRTTIDFGVPELNRPGKVRREVTSQLWQYFLILASGVVLVGVVLLSLSSQLVWDTAIRGLENSLQAVSAQAKQSAGFADNYKNYSGNYDRYSADWDTVYSSLQTYNDNLVLVLEELETILPENTSVTGLQIAADGMSVSFACQGKEEAAYLIMALRELKYADLTSISNLGGGGAGPAESYGPDKDTPPTKGSYNPETDGLVEVTFTLATVSEDASALKALIRSELTSEELMTVGLGLSERDVKLLEAAYGKIPATTFETLEALKSDAKPAPTFQDREAALTEMLSSDPFAANRFVDLLIGDASAKESILGGDIWRDIFELGIFDLLGNTSDADSDSNTGDTAENLKQLMDDLIGILTKDDVSLTATENLLCAEEVLTDYKDSGSELTYVHYLEVQLGIRGKEAFPFLNMDKVVADLLKGGFNTGDTVLDDKLNGLISDETWALLRELGSQESVSQMVAAYLKDGTTGEPVADEMIADYLNNGTTGYADLDKRVEAYLNSEDMKITVQAAMVQYLRSGASGYQILNLRFERFFASGTTGISALDAHVERSLESAEVKGVIAELLDKYLETNSTGNSTLDAWISQYFLSGTSGCAQLNQLFGACINSGSLDSRVTLLVNAYQQGGTSNHPVLDQLIAKYKASGNSGNIYLDRIFSKLLVDEEDPDEGPTEEELMNLFEKFLVDGTAGEGEINKKFNTYLTQGTSGNDAVDKAIVKYLESSRAEEVMGSLVNKYLTDGTTGSKITDTLIDLFFTSGSTGTEKIDGMIDSFIEDGSADAQLDKLVGKYVETGSSGIDALNKKLNMYFAEGTTGSLKLDSLLKAKLPEEEPNPFDGLTEKQIKDMLDDYFALGTCGNPNADKILDQYMSTGTTGDGALDGVLNTCLASPEADGYITNMLLKYFAKGTTGRVNLDKMIDAFVLNGTSGSQVVDVAIIGSMGANKDVKRQVVMMVERYLDVNTTGNLVMDKAIENYLVSGSSGNKHLDNVIEEYLDENPKKLEAKMDEMFADYLANGTCGYNVFNTMIDKYLNSDPATTGNPYADKVLKEYADVKFANMFQNYLKTGSSGVPGADKLIEAYLMSGTTGNAGYDRLLDGYMQSNAVKLLLKGYVDKFNEKQDTGNSKLNTVFNLYYLYGTTGNKKLDALLKDAGLLTKYTGSGNTTIPEDIWNQLFGNGSTGTGGTASGPADTRVTFSVSLAYNEELAKAELIRKGLDYSGKIDKVEVEE